MVWLWLRGSRTLVGTTVGTYLPAHLSAINASLSVAGPVCKAVVFAAWAVAGHLSSTDHMDSNNIHITNGVKSHRSINKAHSMHSNHMVTVMLTTVMNFRGPRQKQPQVVSFSLSTSVALPFFPASTVIIRENGITIPRSSFWRNNAACGFMK